MGFPFLKLLQRAFPRRRKDRLATSSKKQPEIVASAPLSRDKLSETNSNVDNLSFYISAPHDGPSKIQEEKAGLVEPTASSRDESLPRVHVVLHNPSVDAASPGSLPQVASSIWRLDCGQTLNENATTQLDEIEHNVRGQVRSHEGPTVSTLGAGLLAERQAKTTSVEKVLTRDAKLGGLIDEAKLSVVKPEVTVAKNRLKGVESVPDFKCQLVRGGILGINSRYLVNRRHSRPSSPLKSIHPTDSFQEEEQEDSEKLFGPGLSSREPLCGTCQDVIRSFSKTEWHALVLSTKESLQKRASKGCPLCTLYMSLIAPHFNTKTAVGDSTSPTEGLWTSDEKSITGNSLAIVGQGHEVVYKRDTGTKLILLFLGKKYTVVLDWRYPSIKWSWPTSTAPSLYIGPPPTSQNELLPEISELMPIYPELLNLEQHPSVFGRSLATAQKWLEQCDGHKSCRAHRSQFVPTRLIQIGGGMPPSIRLVNGSQLDYYLQYMTLSHCWGEVRFQILLKENEAAFMQRIVFENLPKTFQDAILVARKLTITYLWIDSLCIIQDSLEDWQKESVLMGKVYSSSYLNICATAAVDGSKGLLFDRNRIDLQIVQLRMRESRHTDARPCFAHDAEFFIKSIDRAPLNRRGWVLQERLLSRCNLHFGANQLLWECCEMNACEIMPDGLVAGISRPLMKDAISTMRGLKSLRLHGDRADLWAYGKWADIVRAYTEALLTHHTDRLVAISGLALIFQDFIVSHYPTRPEYLAGIWGERNHLATQLLWHAKRIRSIPESTFASIAPTWSWASVDGPIDDIFKFRHAAADMITVTHPYAVTNIVTDDIFGQVSSGRLSLRGKLARILYTALPTMTADGIELPPHGIIKIQEYRPIQDFHWYTGNMESRNCLHTNLWWDRLLCPRSTVANGRLFLLPIRGDHDGNGDNMEGLILESTDPNSVTTAKILSIVPSQFRRVGKWTAYNRASVDRVRAGCQYFDRHAPEEADIDQRREVSNVWRGKTYAISII